MARSSKVRDAVAKYRQGFAEVPVQTLGLEPHPVLDGVFIQTNIEAPVSDSEPES
jgi:hypothetical protein